MLEVRPGAVRVADPEHGRQSNALVGLQLEREPARESGPPGWVIEVPSQPEGVLSARSASISASTERALIPDRLRLAAHRAAWKSRSVRVPTTHTRSSSAESPAAIVSGISADGRSTPTAVGSR